MYCNNRYYEVKFKYKISLFFKKKSFLPYQIENLKSISNFEVEINTYFYSITMVDFDNYITYLPQKLKDLVATI